ncbi:hypothetical protein ACHAW6_003606 [Cyclotella cf. meneghiniana]
MTFSNKMTESTSKLCLACMGFCMQSSLPMNCWENVSTHMNTITANSYLSYGNTTRSSFGSHWW